MMELAWGASVTIGASMSSDRCVGHFSELERTVTVTVTVTVVVDNRTYDIEHWTLDIGH